jgi:DNA polymerase-3 subunit alpha
MKEVERVGLLKMDFLGLSTLTLIDDALKEIKRTEGVDLDIDNIPLDDPKTYRCSGGAAYGIFQFESSGMRELLRKAKPTRLDDLIALNALYRPGPLKSGMVDDWVERKQGKREVKYELPQLEPISRDTYGVIAYQEQVMRIAQALAGFTLGQADVLRKAMGKKDPKVMAKQREAFHGGAKQKASARRRPQAVRADRVLRRLRLQQVALHRVCLPRVSDGVSQGQLPVALHRGAADHRGAEHRQARDVPGRSARARDHVLQPDINQSQLRFSVEKRDDGRVRFASGSPRSRASAKGRSTRSSPRASSSADGFRPARAVRNPRSAAGQQARVRGAGQVRRV